MRRVTKFCFVLYKEKLVGDIEICFYRGMFTRHELVNRGTLKYRAELHGALSPTIELAGR